MASRGLTPVQERILADRREHHLFLNEQGEYELAPIAELPVGDEALKAYWFRRDSCPERVNQPLYWSSLGDFKAQIPRHRPVLSVSGQ